ncbi:hypothetical protein D3C87_1421920 [compost metagenome]
MSESLPLECICHKCWKSIRQQPHYGYDYIQMHPLKDRLAYVRHLKWIISWLHMVLHLKQFLHPPFQEEESQHVYCLPIPIENNLRKLPDNCLLPHIFLQNQLYPLLR